MNTIGKVFALAALTLVFATGAGAQDCTLKQAASLPMAVESDGTISVTIKIDNADEKFRLALESASSSIKKSAADALGLKKKALPHGMMVVSIAGATAVQAIFHDVQLGGIHGTDVAVLEFPDAGTPDTIGDLGLDLLIDFDIDLDFAGGKLNLYSPDHCPGKVVYWASAYGSAPLSYSGGRLLLDLSLDGQPVRGLLTTAWQTPSMLLSTATQKFGIAPNSPDLKLVSAADSSSPAIYEYPFKSLSVGDVSILNPVIQLRDAADICGHPLATVLGSLKCNSSFDWDTEVVASQLRKLHVYIATKEGKIYVTAANAHR